MSSDLQFYDQAKFYDLIYRQGSFQEAKMILRLAKKHSLKVRRIFEPACGSARVLLLLAKRGYRCAGLDLNQQMLEYAKARARRMQLKNIDLFFGDMKQPQKFTRSPVDLSFNLIGSIRHLMSEEDLQIHLKNLKKITKPKGLYLVGLNFFEEKLKKKPMVDIWKSARGSLKAQVRVEYRYLAPRKERVSNELKWRSPKQKGSSQMHYELRTYTADQWLASIKKSGWILEAVYNDAGQEVDMQRHGHYLFALRLPE